MMDGAELKRIRRYALAKATLAEAASIKTVERAMCLRGGFMGVEGLHFDDDNDDDEDDEDDEHNIISFLKRIRDNELRESDNELRERVDEWRRNVC